MSWPLHERAGALTATERRKFERIVRGLPEPAGPFEYPMGGQMVYLSSDPFRRRPRWPRRIAAAACWLSAVGMIVAGVLLLLHA